MTEQEIADICDQLAEGKSLRAICREMGKPESSVRYWLNKDDEAFAHSARARELGCDALADECLEIADGQEPTDVRRIRIDTRIRLIGKWSQRYSDKLAITNNTTVTHKHDLGSLNTAELEQLETILAKSERGAGDAGEQVASSVH
ncbi:MAG: helix-turn-helix domain-containing protein [Beijerinckiaceae bacterium]